MMGWLAEMKRFLVFYLLLRNYALFTITFTASSLITWLALSYHNQQQAHADQAPHSTTAPATAPAPPGQAVSAGLPAYTNLQLEPPVYYYRLFRQPLDPDAPRWLHPPPSCLVRCERIGYVEFAKLKIQPNDRLYEMVGVLSVGAPYKEHPLDYTNAYAFEYGCGHFGAVYYCYRPQGPKHQPGECFEFGVPEMDMCWACRQAAKASGRQR